MKRFIFSLALTLIIFSVYSQEHLSFKGIPIEGSITSFCQKLKAKGFTKIGSDNNITAFTGDFTGRQATIGVVATDNGQDVHLVGVAFKSSDDWRNLVRTYDHYKDLYTLKYGKPTANQENNPSSLDSNIMLMHELMQGTVTYYCLWDVTGGTIELSIKKSTSYGDGFVCIRYIDAINTKEKLKNDLNDI